MFFAVASADYRLEPFLLFVCALSKYKYSRSKFVLLTTPPMHLQFDKANEKCMRMLRKGLG